MLRLLHRVTYTRQRSPKSGPKTWKHDDVRASNAKGQGMLCQNSPWTVQFRGTGCALPKLSLNCTIQRDRVCFAKALPELYNSEGQGVLCQKLSLNCTIRGTGYQRGRVCIAKTLPGLYKSGDPILLDGIVMRDETWVYDHESHRKAQNTVGLPKVGRFPPLICLINQYTRSSTRTLILAPLRSKHVKG